MLTWGHADGTKDTQQTNVKNATLEPVFNESFDFAVR
jgi:hypothetical protein